MNAEFNKTLGRLGSAVKVLDALGFNLITVSNSDGRDRQHFATRDAAASLVASRELLTQEQASIGLPERVAASIRRRHARGARKSAKGVPIAAQGGGHSPRGAFTVHA